MIEKTQQNSTTTTTMHHLGIAMIEKTQQNSTTTTTMHHLAHCEIPVSSEERSLQKHVKPITDPTNQVGVCEKVHERTQSPTPQRGSHEKVEGHGKVAGSPARDGDC